MRQKIRQFPVIFIFLLNLFTIYTWGKEYRPEVGVRALGMAGAFTGSADDATAALWNPAGLAKLKHKSIFVYDFSQGALSFAYPIERVGTFGISILDLNYKDRFIYDKLYNPLGKFEVGYNQITLSYARTIGNHLMMGANFGYNRIPWEDSPWQPSFDAGIITRVKSIFIGGRITDIADTKFYNHEGKPLKNFYQQISIGASWIPSKHISINSDLNAAKRKIRLGMEVGWKGIYLRSGAIRNLNKVETPLGWTAGASINLSGVQLNYAYLNDDGIDYKHLISLGFEFVGIGQKRPRTLGLPKNESQIHRLSPAISHTPRRLQMKSTLKSEVNPTITKTDETIRTHPIKLPIVDNPLKNNSLLEANTALEPQQTSESEAEFNESDNSKSNPEDSETLIVKLGKKYNIELPLILAVIEIESRFKPDNVSQAGAVGLMQLMPVTARELGLRVPMYKDPMNPISNPRLDERFDPKKNIEAGMKFLSKMINKYKKNYVLALCAYNAGPGRVDKNVPTIRETEKHVGRVLNRYYEYQNSPRKMRNALEILNAVLGE
ncbi:TPA: lytic transglycosylase domain-containing protein [Candidatus Poribacteria bacterium]|nr:lytic transglycosylase domain-containing protein [Candidatus Poribacteria bacterium]